MGPGSLSEAHLLLLRRLVLLLDRYGAEVTAVQLGADLETWLKVRGALETAAQCAIDLALAMAARRGLGPVESYRQVFALLGDAGVLPAPLVADMQGWAGLRNVLAHVYTMLDLETLHAALHDTESLKQFTAIAAADLQATAP